MNYYDHHIRDYDAATAHLSWEQDLAYTRLLRWYYRKELPIPADVSEACRQVRATTKPQKAAVASVLQEFFVLQGDGWHQEKCDEAIANYLAGEPEREVKKANEDNRVKRHREERSRLFKILTDAGEHAPWNIRIEDLRKLATKVSGAELEPPEPETAMPPATAPATPATATQYPLPITQYPVVNQTSTANVIARASRTARDDDFVPKNEGEWLRHMASKHGFDADATNVHDRKRYWPIFAAWCNAGIKTSQVDAAVKKAREDASEPISNIVAYANRILDQLTTPRKPKVDAWWLSNQSMSAKARELGIADARPGENPPEFKARIQQAIESKEHA
jgi:uncharacterized protein YdaU (DUF1376 family)